MFLLFFAHAMKGNAMIINKFYDDDSSTLSLLSNDDWMCLSELGSSSSNVLDNFLQDNDNDFFTDKDEIDDHTDLMVIFVNFLGWHVLEIDKLAAETFGLTAIRRHE